MQRRVILYSAIACGYGALAGCSFLIGTDDRVAADAGTPDVLVDAGPCDRSQPFSTPKYEPKLSSIPYGDETVRLTPDELEAYVSRRTSLNYVDLFRYRRPNLGADWELVGKEPELSRFPDGGATSATAMTFLPGAMRAIVQYYDVPTSPAGSLSWTTRDSLDASWTAPQAAAGLESNSQDNAPWLSQDGKTIYFYSDRVGGWRTFTASATGNGWSKPVQLGPVLKYEDTYPVLTGDELTIYFAQRDTQPSPVRHVWRATRPSRDVEFSAAEEVPELNRAADPSLPSWVSPDGCRIYIVAIRDDSLKFDVYSAAKPTF